MKPFSMLMSFGFAIAQLMFITNLPSFWGDLQLKLLLIFPMTFIALGMVLAFRD